MFFHALQQQQFGRVESKAESAQDKAQRLEVEVNDLRRRCDAVAIGCQAMWELLRERSDMTDETILERIREIDLRDGKADGKMGETMKQCPACGRSTNASRQTCLYCGAALPPVAGENVFGKR